MDHVSSRNFPEVYENLGIDTNKLGCIMLDVKPIEVGSVIDPEDLNHDPEDEFAQEIISEEKPHVTLLYGLISSGQAMREHVDVVLADWKLDSVQIVGVTAFEGNPDYTPLVAAVSTEGLDEANARPRPRPHIDRLTDGRAIVVFWPSISLVQVCGLVWPGSPEIRRRTTPSASCGCAVIRGVGRGRVYGTKRA